MSNQSGQAAVEYMLMLAVVAVLMGGIFDKLRTYMVGTGTCPNPSFICRVIEVYSGPGMFDGSYRYFSLSR